MPNLLNVWGIVWLSICTLQAQPSSLPVKLNQLIAARYPDSSFSGIVQLYQGDSLVFELEQGWADRAQGIPLHKEHLFNVGSLLKPLCSAAVLSLLSEQKLSLEETLSKWFPDWPQAQDIRIRHLLSHTAGIPDLFGQPWFYWHISNAEVVKNLQSTPLLFEPGEAFAYSNAGYILLAELVGMISHSSFWDYLQTQHLQDLKMYHTLPAYPPPKGIARAYSKSGEIQEVYMKTLGDGGIYTSVEDLSRWAKAYFGGRLVPDTLWQEACQAGQLNSGSPAGKILLDDQGLALAEFSAYGLGWFIEDTPEGPWVFHYGISGAYYTEMHYHLEKKYLLLIFNNTAGEGVSRLSREIRESILLK